MVTDQQVRRLFTVQNRYEYQYQAADAAGISSKTAHKYLKSGKLPSQCRVEHTWPTREDPLADHLINKGALHPKKISGRLVFERAELDRVLANGDHKRSRGRPRKGQHLSHGAV